VIPVGEVGTDRHRLDMWTKDRPTAYNAYGIGHDWRLDKFVKTNGYVSVALEGCGSARRICTTARCHR
jgi:hypothetical protein